MSRADSTGGMKAGPTAPSSGKAPGTLLDLDQVKIDPAWALKIPSTLAVRKLVLPFVAVDGVVHVACQGDCDSAVMQALARYLQHPVKLEPSEPASLKKALDRVYGSAAEATNKPGMPAANRTGGGEARSPNDVDGDDAIGLCHELLYAAIIRQASDVHLDPERERVQVRFRVDGRLEEYRQLPIAAHLAIISRFKVVAGMDIAERRAPQDGRFTHQGGPGGMMVDVRVASLPTRHGERMTLRLLAVQTRELTMEKLGLLEPDRQLVEQAIDRPHGMVLITGSTGSGKTTTLYAALRRLIARKSVNVITIEDPIEYDIHGVAQVEVDGADKVSFAKALRSVLRHDPDVVMIGEIRDRETADVAIKAALTGHLVLSTLHTNSAASAVTRLADMGTERYLVAATLRLAVAQRLVRRLCQHCRKPRPLSATEAALLAASHLAGETVYDPAGCIYCANRGYVGRLGIFELMPVDEALSRRIAEGCEEAELVSHLRTQGIPRLIDDGLTKLLAGETSPAELAAAVVAW